MIRRQLIAALTALLVVEATLARTLVNGVQRVLSVVAGVALAVLLASVVGLTWWSLGALVAASIVVGQLLRLGPHLLEVPISAMLVLGVGHAAGAESVASGRIMETVVGAIAGVLVNVAFPPPVATRDASRAVTAFAKRSRRCCRWRPRRWRAARFRATSPRRAGGRPPTHSPCTPRRAGLAHAEQSRRLNLRALRHPPQGGLRSSLDALEHTSISMRTLFRAMHDATQRRTGVQDDPDYATHVRCSAAVLMADMATVLWAFGRCAHGRTAARPSSNTSSWPARWHPCDAAATGSKTYSSGTRAAGRDCGNSTPHCHHRRPDAAGARRRHDHRRPDQRRTRQALGRLRAAVHDATHRPDSRGASGQEPPKSTERP